MTHPALSLAELSFDNTFVRDLPADPDRSPRRRQVLGACYSWVEPTPVAAPRLIAHAREVLELLGLAPSVVDSSEFAAVFAGNRVLPGMQPYAACYGGHQFGHWAGQLGDGRAISLAEVRGANGERWELQLKGAGPTPYSRTADGRAVLRSSLREFLCSEAMFHLGVPTTRALCLVGTGEQVMRDMLYDGHPQFEPGAVVCRVAPSFLRFGNYELPASRKDLETLRALADYTLARHFPELGIPHDAASRSQIYVRWFEEVCRRTVTLIVHWMRVGFVHGVMNTDNMSVLGLTIDYGPYGWLEDYDPTWTPNTTDAQGRRYRYGQQPNVAAWNLSCFASALVPLVGDTAGLQAALERSVEAFDAQLLAMQHAKLGLTASPAAAELARTLPERMHACQLDMTLFYRRLAKWPCGDSQTDVFAACDREAAGIIDTLSYASPTDDERQQLASWLARYTRCAREQGISDPLRRERMDAVNPKYVLRNYIAQLAIDSAQAGDPGLIDELLQVLRAPYAEQPEAERWAAKRPEWARHRVGCSMLSCSS